MKDVANVVLRRTISQARIAKRDGVRPCAPSIVTTACHAAGTVGIYRISKTVTEGIVGVELQTAPRSLSQVHLERVVVGVSAAGHVLRLLAGSIGVRLEEVDGLACACSARVTGIGDARLEAGPNEVAEVRRGSIA